ncbi:RDD family protein [Lentibacter algarum]|uniref:RDD family protein n=1 Tax=Lentibacter algarum TaxID=576131 RepID=UPI001C06C682|nr:RDD family protein [Lentibacter algarum]MBU2980839.1 RDD family protein [Lentibacter algarum]
MSDQTWALPDPHYQPEFYADVPLKRFLAWLVDVALIVVLVVVIVPFTAFTGLFFLPLLYFIVSFIYRFVTLSNGAATPGMRLTAIELRNAQGEKITSNEALMHTFGLALSFGFPLLQLVSVVLMVTSERGQGLSDMALGTVALNRRARR